MPDTGAPWNIPYVAPSDLVRDYPSDSEDLADAIADGLDAAGGLVAVETTTKTDTFTTSNSAYTTVTGLSVTITPKNANNRLIVQASVAAAPSGTSAADRSRFLSIFRDGTNLAVPTSPGSRTPTIYLQRSLADLDMVTATFMFVVPATNISATTFDVRVAAPGTGDFNVNRGSFTDTDNTFHGRGVSTLTVMEVKV
jgi:hypothetical protein